mmetsp:Transcript_16152/g.62988  ORF Transcript_16152/g.62988 Transcript_16152/m.62988 type:complete len:825 (+) Transcript_16152:59-2533(+)
MYGLLFNEEKTTVRSPAEELQQVFVGRKTVAQRCTHLHNVVQNAAAPGQGRSKAVVDFFNAVPRVLGLVFELSTSSVSKRNSWLRGEHKGITRATILQLLSISSTFATAEKQEAKLAEEQSRRGPDFDRLRTMFSPDSLNSSRTGLTASGAAVPGYCSLPELLRRHSPSPEAQRTWDQALGGIVLSGADDAPATQFPFPLEYLPAPVRRLLDEKKVEGLSELFVTRMEVVVNMGTDEKPNAVRMPLNATFDRGQVLYFELKLNLFEYYLFHFAHFPTVARRSTEAGDLSTSLTQSSGLRNSVGGAVTTQFGRNAVNTISAAEQYFNKWTSPKKAKHTPPYVDLLRSYLRYFFPTEAVLVKHLESRQLYAGDNDEARELKERIEYARTFLQLMVEFWLGANKPSAKDMKNKTANKNIPMSSLLDGSAGGKKALEFVVLPELCLTAIKEYILHLMRDPWLSRDVAQEEDRFRGTRVGYDSSPAPSMLTSALVAVQRPLYDFLKLSFNEWPFNETNTPFLKVVEIWLAYIRPWDHTTHGTDTIDRQRILKWRAFLHQNCLLYTSLFERFLNAAKHFNTVTADHELEALERVFEVFSSPGLMQALDECEGIIASLSSEFLPVSVPSYGKREQQAIQEHCMALGVDVVGNVFLRSEASLANVKKVLGNLVEDMGACRSYMDNRLRESSMHKEERIRRVGSDLAGLFGLDWAATVRTKATLTSSGNRVGNHDRQRRSKLEVEYLGDAARRPITSMENAFLVRQLYKLSLYLQRRFDLERTPNLRPLASYQMHVFVVVVAIVVYLLWQFALFIVFVANQERIPRQAYRRRL